MELADSIINECAPAHVSIYGYDAKRADAHNSILLDAKRMGLPVSIFEKRFEQSDMGLETKRGTLQKDTP